MQILLGLILIFVVPAFFAILFWLTVAQWVKILQGRDVMSRFRPHRKDVARAERELKVL